MLPPGTPVPSRWLIHGPQLLVSADFIHGAMTGMAGAVHRGPLLFLAGGGLQKLLFGYAGGHSSVSPAAAGFCECTRGEGCY